MSTATSAVTVGRKALTVINVSFQGKQYPYYMSVFNTNNHTFIRNFNSLIYGIRLVSERDMCVYNPEDTSAHCSGCLVLVDYGSAHCPDFNDTT